MGGRCPLARMATQAKLALWAVAVALLHAVATAAAAELDYGWESPVVHPTFARKLQQAAPTAGLLYSLLRGKFGAAFPNHMANKVVERGVMSRPGLAYNCDPRLAPTVVQPSCLSSKYKTQASRGFRGFLCSKMGAGLVAWLY